MACLLAIGTASRQLRFAPAEAIVSRGNCRAALPLARLGAARVSARSVRRTPSVLMDTKDVLAIWGAITGTIGTTIGIFNYLRDRAHLNVHVSAVTGDELQDIDRGFLVGSTRRYLLVDVANAGRRPKPIYYPELWLLNELGLLSYDSPSWVFFEGQWSQINDKWRTFRLEEGGFATFVFGMDEKDRFVRVDVPDTLAKRARYTTPSGQIRWWQGKLRARLSVGKTWKQIRDALFSKDRPRFHSKD